jgi:hypothetical protein
MLELITVLASVEGEESSKSLFYIAGGLLAAWAVLVSVVGMRGTFPSSDGAARGVMGVTAALVAFACAAAVITG